MLDLIRTLDGLQKILKTITARVREICTPPTDRNRLSSTVIGITYISVRRPAIAATAIPRSESEFICLQIQLTESETGDSEQT